MNKTSSHFVCQACGSVHSKWAGKCDGCGAWDTLVEERLEVAPKALKRNAKDAKISLVMMDATLPPEPRLATGIAELDRVLGGGLVPGCAILMGGDPGIGKSTLLLQLCASLDAQGVKTAYLSGEESVAQIQLRANRLGIKAKQVQLATANAVRDIVATLDAPDAPLLVIIDSIQTMFVDMIDSAPGTVAQVRASSNELIKLAKRRNLCLVLVGHVTKDGQIAGPRVMEHMVDTVLYFEGDRGQPYRIVRSVKNRFGATDEIGVFSMGEKGLHAVENPSSLFLNPRQEAVSGSVVFAGVEGTRPVLVEIQALVAPSGLATPRRAVVGWDSQRLAMILAVLEARGGVKFSDREVYLNVAGGLKIAEPAADLAVAGALLSAFFDVPLPQGYALFGEIGLSGEVRPVGRTDLRLREASKLGFANAMMPPVNTELSGEISVAKGVRIIHHIHELVAFFAGQRYETQQEETQYA